MSSSYDPIRSALERALAGIRGPFEAELRALAEGMARAASEEKARAVAQAVETGVAEVRRQAQAQLNQLRETAQKHAEDVRKSAEAQAKAAEAQAKAAEAQAKAAEADVNDLKRAMEEARRATEMQIAQARRNHEAEIDQVRRSHQAEIEQVRRDGEAELEKTRIAAGAEVERVRSEEKANAEARAAEAQQTFDRRVAELQEEIDRVRQSSVSEAEDLVVAQLETAALDSERKQAAAMDRALTDRHQASLARAARLADAIRALDEARALGDVLATLAECAGREVDRAAVLVVKGERLNGWRLAGFSSGAPSAKSIDLPLDEAGLPGAVVRTGVAVSRPAVEPGPSQERQPALPPFAQDAGARHALALPITVGGAVVAVLYGDAPRLDAPSDSSRWPAILDVLARHASRVLEAMTVQQAAGLTLRRPVARGSHGSLPGPLEQSGTGAEEDAARRYARLLLSEIRMYHEPLVEAGRQSRDLMSRLGGEIERARQLYEARVPASVSARSMYFEQELVRTLADGDPSLLGSVQ